MDIREEYKIPLFRCILIVSVILNLQYYIDLYLILKTGKDSNISYMDFELRNPILIGMGICLIYVFLVSGVFQYVYLSIRERLQNSENLKLKEQGEIDSLMKTRLSIIDNINNRQSELNNLNSMIESEQVDLAAHQDELTKTRDDVTKARDELTKTRDDVTKARDEWTKTRDGVTKARDELKGWRRQKKG